MFSEAGELFEPCFYIKALCSCALNWINQWFTFKLGAGIRKKINRTHTVYKHAVIIWCSLKMTYFSEDVSILLGNTSLIFHFWIVYLLIWNTKWQRRWPREICQLSSFQVTITTITEPGWSLEPRTPPGYSTGTVGAQAHEPSSTVSLGVSGGAESFNGVTVTSHCITTQTPAFGPSWHLIMFWRGRWCGLQDFTCQSRMDVCYTLTVFLYLLFGPCVGTHQCVLDICKAHSIFQNSRIFLLEERKSSRYWEKQRQLQVHCPVNVPHFLDLIR